MKINTLFIVLLSFAVVGCNGSGSTPPPVDMAPTISAIADQSTSANVSSAAIAFSVIGSSALTIAATSDNQAVVPDAGLNVVANGATSSITVTPIVDILGDAFITIVVTDQAGMSANTSFLLSIVAQQVSVQQFVRSEFMQPEDGNPVPINAIVFDQDADNDDFADLLQ